MNKQIETGVKRINFDIPTDLHRQLKAKFSSEGKTFKSVLLPVMEACLRGDETLQIASENGNPGAEVSLLDKKINELLEAKLSNLIEADVDKIDGAKVDGDDPEDRIYRTKRMDKEPTENPGGKFLRGGVPPLKEYSVEPVIPVEKPGEKAVSVEESVEAERVVEAANGLIATGKKVSLAEKVVLQRRIIGKMIILAEQAKRGFFDWFCDGGRYTVVTAEERDVELAEREKDRLAEREKDRLAEEKEE